MKAQEIRAESQQRNRFEADLAARLNALFRRCPTLCGFAVRDAAGLAKDGLALEHASGLFVTEVSVYPLSGLVAPTEICREILLALVRLIEERPGADELLRERSFARVFH
jgi:hypothetical protein